MKIGHDSKKCYTENGKVGNTAITIASHFSDIVEWLLRRLRDMVVA